MSEWQTEDFIFPKLGTGRGSKVERLPGGPTWNPDELEVLNRQRGNNEIENLHQTFKVSYDVDYTVDFSIEDIYYEQIGRAMMKSIDEEIMKVLMGDTPQEYVLSAEDKQFITDNDYISTEMLMEYVCGNLEKQDPKYSDYERAMSIVKEK